MTRWFKAVLLGACLLPALGMAQQWEEGTHYKKLSDPVRTVDESKIEVAEVFWYGCRHCQTFKPMAEEWEESEPEDVNYVRIPEALGDTWEPHARAFYTLEALGAMNDEIHTALFEALAGERRQLGTAEELATFLSEYGVDEDEFIKTFDSFGVNAKMKQARAKVIGGDVTGTPTVLVNGKYQVTASMAGGHEKVLEVVDYLVEQELDRES